MNNTFTGTVPNNNNNPYSSTNLLPSARPTAMPSNVVSSAIPGTTQTQSFSQEQYPLQDSYEGMIRARERERKRQKRANEYVT